MEDSCEARQPNGLDRATDKMRTVVREATKMMEDMTTDRVWEIIKNKVHSGDVEISLVNGFGDHQGKMRMDLCIRHKDETLMFPLTMLFSDFCKGADEVLKNHGGDYNVAQFAKEIVKKSTE